MPRISAGAGATAILVVVLAVLGSITAAGYAYDQVPDTDEGDTITAIAKNAAAVAAWAPVLVGALAVIGLMVTASVVLLRTGGSGGGGYGR